MSSEPQVIAVGSRVTKNGPEDRLGTVETAKPLTIDQQDPPVRIDYTVRWDDGEVTAETSQTISLA